MASLAVFIGVGFSSVGLITPAQDVPTAPGTIRVQSNQVLVPVIVFDQKRADELGQTRIAASREAEIPIVEAWVRSMGTPGLTAKDFRLLQDGVEQKVDDVSFEQTPYWNFRDNMGYHTEIIGPGGGKWSGTEWPAGRVADLIVPHYVITYQPPDSAEGTCHAIEVKVDRANTQVYARRRYCNTSHPGADPLKGTRFGDGLERNLSSVVGGKLGIGVSAVVLFGDRSDDGRVHIAINLPVRRVRSSQIGILGLVYSTDGSTVTRFSDTTGFDDTADPGYRFGPGEVPARYETQLTLPNGEYDLRVAYRNGGEFGRAATHLVVTHSDSSGLAVSEMALCKRIQQIGGTDDTLAGTWKQKMASDYFPLAVNGIEFKPTADINFTAKETMYVYFQIYRAVIEGIQPTVEVHLRIIDANTKHPVEDFSPVDATQSFKKNVPVASTARKISLESIPRGSYELQLQATDSSGNSTDWRSADFGVE